MTTSSGPSEGVGDDSVADVRSRLVDDIQVLHVDDNPAMLDLTAEFLERANDAITVVSESDPEVVTNRITAEPIDCVVSDYQMPGLDGVELGRQVRETAPDQPFLLFTSRESAELVDHVESGVITDYVQKSSGVQQYKLLANRIRLTVSRYRALNSLREHQRGP